MIVPVVNVKRNGSHKANGSTVWVLYMRSIMTRAGTPLLSMQAEMTVVEPYLCGAPSYAPIRSYNFQMAFSLFSLVASSTRPAAHGDCGSIAEHCSAESCARP